MRTQSFVKSKDLMLHGEFLSTVSDMSYLYLIMLLYKLLKEPIHPKFLRGSAPSQIAINCWKVLAVASNTVKQCIFHISFRIDVKPISQLIRETRQRQIYISIYPSVYLSISRLSVCLSIDRSGNRVRTGPSVHLACRKSRLHE